jgi:hypothetical protein
MFNKYEFIDELRGALSEAIDKGEITEDYQIDEYVNDEIKNIIIYYGDCFDIVRDCGFVDWSDSDYEVKCISSAAYAALRELVSEEINYTEFENLLKEKQENEQSNL